MVEIVHNPFLSNFFLYYFIHEDVLSNFIISFLRIVFYYQPFIFVIFLKFQQKHHILGLQKQILDRIYFYLLGCERPTKNFAFNSIKLVYTSYIAVLIQFSMHFIDVIIIIHYSFSRTKSTASRISY